MSNKLMADEPDGGLSFLGRWAPFFTAFILMAARYVALWVGAKLPDWAPPELRTDAFWIGLMVSIVAALWGAARTWKRHAPAAAGRGTGSGGGINLGRTLSAVALLCSVLWLTGCASAYDNKSHWPITGYSTEKAYRLAEASGFRRVDVGGGEGRWVAQSQLSAFGADAEAMMKTNGTALLEISMKQRELARSVGLTDEQVVAMFNPNGKTWAQVGDSALVMGILSGIGYAVSQAGGGGDGGSTATDPAATAKALPAVGAGVASSQNSGVIAVAQPGGTVIVAAGAGTSSGSEMGAASSAGKHGKR